MMINKYIIGNNCLIFEKIKVDFIILNFTINIVFYNLIKVYKIKILIISLLHI